MCISYILHHHPPILSTVRTAQMCVSISQLNKTLLLDVLCGFFVCTRSFMFVPAPISNQDVFWKFHLSTVLRLPNGKKRSYFDFGGGWDVRWSYFNLVINSSILSFVRLFVLFLWFTRFCFTVLKGIKTFCIITYQSYSQSIYKFLYRLLTLPLVSLMTYGKVTVPFGIHRCVWEVGMSRKRPGPQSHMTKHKNME